MTTPLSITRALGLLAAFAVTACGGGGTGTTSYTPDSALFVAGAPATSLAVVGLDIGTKNTFAQTTTLTPPNTLSGGRLTGTVNYAYTTGATNSISLSGGKTASLEDNGNMHAFRFGNADMIGVAGVAATNVPSSGTASYSGFADVVANDGSPSPKVLTVASATANFGSGRVGVYMSNSSGDWLRIDNATISANTYSGGDVTVSNSFATRPSSSGSLQHEGRFFEQNATELGGVFILDRTGAGIDFEAKGVYGVSSGS